MIVSHLFLSHFLILCCIVHRNCQVSQSLRPNHHKTAMLSNSLSQHGQLHGFQSSNPLPSGNPTVRSIRASRPQVLRACLDDRLKVGRSASLRSMCSRESEIRIREQLQKVELSASSYDTAWVAMIPSRGSPHSPCFPQCVEWVLQSQHADGSWGLDHLDSSLQKDALSSTLACILALKKWNVGEKHIRKGLQFIGKNFSRALDDTLVAPVGFNIIFPGMLSFAIDMGLDFPISQTDLHGILHLRDMELKRGDKNRYLARKAYMAYVAEGLGNMQDWNEVMMYQRKNGSLFNSPSTTAAALIHIYDSKALEYLNSLIRKFGSSVPTAYPLEIYTQLCLVDNLEKMGISRHFATEIKNILDKTYSCWLERDEEIMLDMLTSAMAFRLLRMNGYNVSADELSHFAETSNFYDSVQGHVNDSKTLLELYKASEVSILASELILDKLGSLSGSLLKEQLCSNEGQGSLIAEEVDYALKFPFYATLERLDHRRNIEHFSTKSFQMLKTAYMPCNVNEDLLALSVNDFNVAQSIYRLELKHLESWVKENRLDQLEFARQKQTYCYLSAAATLFSPELSDARISWAKNSVLTTVVDDFFDVGGSREELENLITLVEKWDGHDDEEFYSEQVKILYSAIYTTVNQLGAKASEVQNHSTTNHLIEIWVSLLRSMMNEAEWQQNQFSPTVEEYMTNGYVSFALGPIVLPALYFVGPKLSEDIVKDPDYHELFRLMSTCGRLLNDMQGFEREGSEGKLNSLSLLILHSGGSTSVEEAKREMQKTIDTCRRDLLRLVLREGSAVPRPCKELFWKMCRILHLFYMQTDGFSSPKEMIGTVNSVIHEPLNV